MEPLYLSSYLFFLIDNGQILLWNYKTHEQFVLENEYFLELLNISRCNKSSNDLICNDLLNANVVSTKNEKNSEWGWDKLSNIFHVGTQNVGQKISELSIHEFSSEYLRQSINL